MDIPTQRCCHSIRTSPCTPKGAAKYDSRLDIPQRLQNLCGFLSGFTKRADYLRGFAVIAREAAVRLLDLPPHVFGFELYLLRLSLQPMAEKKTLF